MSGSIIAKMQYFNPSFFILVRAELDSALLRTFTSEFEYKFILFMKYHRTFVYLINSHNIMLITLKIKN
jgi:hypothetical protein